MVPSIGPVELQELLRGEVPEFAPVIQQYVDKWGVGAMNYGLMQQLFEFAVELWLGPRTEQDIETLERIFVFAEKALSDGDPNIQDLICIELLQTLSLDKYRGIGLERFLGEKSYEYLRKYRNHDYS